ncbi:MAG: pitrilysin family protein [Planktotalea sp.]|jgi:zinc protease|uniref:M16 family metallopeptidase n=1 Tax=Planktotalea sp. TaxID=2029877 RepID=UPI000183A650|nr:pitrilysin family protein [Planktotalea sp.]EDZ40790.1 zinc protease [Rhodobacteraceae bacterium HTCC2083]MDG1077678.1 pitrilysin family protein [Planktotalea sp.]MDG1085260.1 pitrilysin family protein [Planktotalea sp.]HCW82918.1 insulinase family protein [Paracoccaceae bacterium]
MKRFFYSLVAVVTIIATPLRADVDIQEVTSPMGFKAWLVEDHTIPFMALRLGFKGGASLDREGKRGSVNLMVALLEEGTGDLDARGFAREVDELAASFNFDASGDSVSVSARMLSENRDAAIALLKGAVAAPSFDQVAIDRVKGQVVSILQSDLKDPNKIAQTAFNKAAFGDHPYGSTLSGTAASIESLTREDIQNAHRDAMARDRVFVSAVGDITAEELGALMDTLLGDLPETGAAMPERVEIGLGSGITVVPYETPQSVALFGHRGIKRDDPNFFAAFIASNILGGGGFDSRLMEEVRDKRGLTYGVYSYLSTRDHAELVVGQVASANDRVGAAIDVIKDEWARLVNEGVSQEELDVTKTFLTGAYPLRFDGNGPIANILVGMQMQGLPKNYINTRNDNVNAVTLEEINRVIKDVYLPDELHFTVVGKPEGLD